MRYFFLLCFFLGVASSASAAVTELSDHGTLTQEQYDILTHDATYGGYSGKNITIFEYSDLECPFCIRHHNQTLPTIVENHAQDVNFVFKNNRGVDHPGTKKKGVAVLCAKQVGGGYAYYQAIHDILSYDVKQKKVFPVGRLFSVIRKYIPTKNQAMFRYCVQKQLSYPTFALETLEAQKLGLSGTPGFVVLNHKTREYVRIEGAYPYETFHDAIVEVSK